MNCPKCKQAKSKTIDIALSDHDELYRQKVCAECGEIYFTVEFIVEDSDFVRKEFAKYHRKVRTKEGA